MGYFLMLSCGFMVGIVYASATDIYLFRRYIRRKRVMILHYAKRTKYYKEIRKELKQWK